MGTPRYWTSWALIGEKNKSDKSKSFEERIEELQALMAKHGHVRGTEKHDKSLGKFCEHMRSARRGNGTGTVITEDRIKASNELGFIWGFKRPRRSRNV